MMLDLAKIDDRDATFDQPIAERIWRQKYQYRAKSGVIDADINATWHRVSRALALAETTAQRSAVQDSFRRAMQGFRLLPAGRILAGAGTGRNVTLSNTFVMRTIPDSVAGIMDTVKEAALTMQMGGGIGFDFSTLRPKGFLVRGLDCPAAGPLAAMDICDATCRMLVTGMGRGAMMATMRCDHPDIVDFIAAKQDRTRLRNFNMSVMITDAFMQAVHADAPWDLIWDGRIIRRIAARALWHKIMQRTYEAAEPGVLFIDRINSQNPLRYLETLAATNSCAEQPLPPNGTCPLASVNLAKLVNAPFAKDASLDLPELRRLVTVAVRMLDNTLDLSRYALAAQAQEAASKRRIGVGVTGLANALIMVGARYGSDRAVALVGDWMRTVQNAAYLASADLAGARGSFPLYDAAQHAQSPMFARLNPEVRAAIHHKGLRNGTLTTIAPTGTTSMLAGNVSSGIEPVFAASYTRTMTQADGSTAQDRIEDYATWLFQRLRGPGAPPTPGFVTAQDLSPRDHIVMQAAAQAWVDSGISKTVNCPQDIPFAAFEDIYRTAYDMGCKGCTTYRPNPITGAVLAT